MKSHKVNDFQYVLNLQISHLFLFFLLKIEE
jgi:hypothetical protein